MKTTWTRMKQIIGDVPARPGIYLSVIEDNGTICDANAAMKKDLELKDPRTTRINFFDLVHPVHTSDFKKTLDTAASGSQSAGTELFIRNGFYHPTKWEITCLGPNSSATNTYLCVGYKILDDDRLKIFNRLVENHFELIMGGLNGIIFHDENGDIIATNHRTASLFNTTMERLYQLDDMSDLWDSKWSICNEAGEKIPFEKAPFITAIRTGKPQKQTLVIQLLNGEKRWVVFNCQPLPKEEWACNRASVLSNILDLTDQELLSHKLKVNEALINSFMQETPNLAWAVNEEGVLIFASQTFYKYFGLDEKDCVNEKLVDLIPPSVARALYEKHMEVFRTGKQLKAIEKVKLADGTNYISHINIFPVSDFDGKKMVGGHAVNVTDKSNIEADLREANERLVTLSRASSNAIWEWDMQTGKIFRNDTLMEMIGFHTSDSKGLSWWLRRIHPEDRDRVSDKVKEATEHNEQSWQDEYRFKCADGSYKHIQDKGFVIYENGLPVKMVGSLLDISDLKELQDALADEKMQRQKEISETVIRVQEKERTRIGHELHDNVNQILSTAMLFLDMMAPNDKEQKQIKDKGISSIKLAIEEIRKLSKELVVPQLKEQGLAENIQYLIDDIHMAHPIRIKFTHDLESDLLSPGKKVTLFRIVQEQLKNILKHSKARKAEILLQTKQETIQLVIKDNGVGFEAKQTYRGIGLSNIFERVSFYNGTVDVNTAPGKGCVVTVSLSVL